MGSGETKEKTEDSKTETNVAIVQFHWQSFGIGASSIVNDIVALGIIILFGCWLKIRCLKYFSFQPNFDFGSPNGYRTGGGRSFKCQITLLNYLNLTPKLYPQETC